MLTNDIESLRTFATAFDTIVNALVESVCEMHGVELILFGGDSILIKLHTEALDAVLKKVNCHINGGQFTFSGGYADTMQGAYLALKLAKSSGKNRIEGPITEIVDG